MLVRRRGKEEEVAGAVGGVRPRMRALLVGTGVYPRLSDCVKYV